jgi:hypothetical protein
MNQAKSIKENRLRGTKAKGTPEALVGSGALVPLGETFTRSLDVVLPEVEEIPPVLEVERLWPEEAPPAGVSPAEFESIIEDLSWWLFLRIAE